MQPEVTFLNGNALLPQIIFESPDSGEFIVTYWPVEKPNKKRKSGLSAGTQHQIILTNLKAATKYSFDIYDKISGRTSGPFSFETPALPDDITASEKHTIDTTQFDGFILVRGWTPRGADVIIDNEGDVVWYHQYDSSVTRPFSWTTQHSILSIYDSARIVEYDLYGNQMLNIDLDDPNIQRKVHHDILYDGKGNIISLTHDSIKMDLRKFGGHVNQFLRADGILVLNPSGKIEWQWNLLQVLDPMKLDPKLVSPGQSLGHANSIAIDRDGHYLVSFRDFSQVWKINSNDGSVIWKLGAGGDLEMDKEAYFIGQHSAYVNDTGDLVLFDNGDRKNRPYSRILSFSIDESAANAKTKINIRLNKELSAAKMCSVETIENEKFLVCTTKRSGIISVVNNTGDVLWRVNLSSPSYRAHYLKDPFENVAGD